MGVGEGVREFPALFRKLKEVSWFPKKGSDCDHLWIKLFIENVVLRLYKREKLQNVSLCSLFFLCSWRNVYWSALFYENSPALNKFCLRASTQASIFFKKHSILNFWECPQYVSVSIPPQQFVRWPYTLYCIRHIRNPGIFRTFLYVSRCMFLTLSCLRKYINPVQPCKNRTLTFWQLLRTQTYFKPNIYSESLQIFNIN